MPKFAHVEPIIVLPRGKSAYVELAPISPRGKYEYVELATLSPRGKYAYVELVTIRAISKDGFGGSDYIFLTCRTDKLSLLSNNKRTFLP